MEKIPLGQVYSTLLNYGALPSNTGVFSRYVPSNFFFNLFHFPKRSKRNDETDEYSRSDSPWGFIGGIMKYFRMSYDEIVFQRSYLTLVLLNRAIPSMKPMEEEDEETDGMTRHEIREGDNLNDIFMNLM